MQPSTLESVVDRSGRDSRRAGRPERILAGEGPLKDFASQMRQLRLGSGLTLREVAQHIHYSPSVVSRMTSGRDLPGWELTRRFVEACGGDAERWHALWIKTVEALGFPAFTPVAGEVPRPETADSPVSFVEQLQLRISLAGSPPYRWLARKTGLSHSTIAAALGGSAVRLPSWRLVAAVLRALEEEEHQIAIWEAAWRKLQIRTAPRGRSPRSVSYASVTAVAPPLGLRDPEGRVRGREVLIGELVEAMLTPPAEPQAGIVVLHGMGGAGKTMVALEIAAAAVHNERRVWWVSAAEQASLVAGLTTVSRDLGATEEELRQFDPADVLWRSLAKTPDRWLLVIDGVDDPTVLDTDHGGLIYQGTGWIRPLVTQGLVLLTSRDRMWPNWCRRYEVGTLPPSDAAQVLLDHCGPRAGQIEDAEALASRLGGLPLALRLAGSYLARAAGAAIPDPAAPMTFAEFHAKLDAMEVPNAGADAMLDAIHRVWDLSLDLLARRGLPDAQRLLRMLSMLADAPIPYRSLLTARSIADTQLRRHTLSSISGLLEALAQVSLIDLELGEEPGHAKLHMHPLVRTAGRVHPYTGQRSRVYLVSAVNLVYQACLEADSPENPPSWPSWQLIAPHALHLFETVYKTNASKELVRKAGLSAALAARWLLARGDFARAERHLRGVAERMRAVLGDGNRDTLRVWLGRATALRKLGNYIEAEAENRAAYEVSVAVFGADHPGTLAIRRDLAIVDLELGRYQGSESTLREVVEVRRLVLGEDHPDTLATRHGLARVLCELGRYLEAKDEFASVYEARVRVLGTEHPDTLTTLRNVARVHDDLGKYADAYEIYIDLHETCVRVLGQEHPDTLLARFDLAKNLLNQGHFKDAENHFQHVLEARYRILGPEHPRTLTTRRYLALAFHSLGLWDRAEAEYQKVYQRRTELLGEDHPHTLTARVNLAVAHRGRGEFAAADSELRVVYEKQHHLIGEDHKDTLATMHELAVTLRELGLYNSAEQLLETVCRKRTEVLGAQHPDTLRGRRDRAGILLALDRSSEALKDYHAVHELSTNVLGSEHPETLHARNELAKVYRYMQDNEAARIELEDVYRLRCKLLGERHPDTLTTLRNHARILHASGHIDRAEEEYRNVLEARLDLYGAEHPYTLIACNNLSALRTDRGQLNEAEREFRRIYDARQRLLGHDHPDTLATRHDLGNVLFKQGRAEEAGSEWSAVLQARIRLFGHDHRDTTATRTALESLPRALRWRRPHPAGQA